MSKVVVWWLDEPQAQLQWCQESQASTTRGCTQTVRTERDMCKTWNLGGIPCTVYHPTQGSESWEEETIWNTIQWEQHSECASVIWPKSSEPEWVWNNCTTVFVKTHDLSHDKTAIYSVQNIRNNEKKRWRQVESEDSTTSMRPMYVLLEPTHVGGYKSRT